jgi:hypothetical protein
MNPVEMTQNQWVTVLQALEIDGQDWEFEEIYEYLLLKDAVMRSNGRAKFSDKEPLE